MSSGTFLRHALTLSDSIATPHLFRLLAADHSALGFGDPESLRRTASTIQYRALTPARFMAAVCGRPQGLPVFACTASPTRTQLQPLSFGDGKRQSSQANMGTAPWKTITSFLMCLRGKICASCAFVGEPGLVQRARCGSLVEAIFGRASVA